MPEPSNKNSRMAAFFQDNRCVGNLITLLLILAGLAGILLRIDNASFLLALAYVMWMMTP